MAADSGSGLYGMIARRANSDGLDSYLSARAANPYASAYAYTDLSPRTSDNSPDFDLFSRNTYGDGSYYLHSREASHWDSDDDLSLYPRRPSPDEDYLDHIVARGHNSRRDRLQARALQESRIWYWET